MSIIQGNKVHILLFEDEIRTEEYATAYDASQMIPGEPSILLDIQDDSVDGVFVRNEGVEGVDVLRIFYYGQEGEDGGDDLLSVFAQEVLDSLNSNFKKAPYSTSSSVEINRDVQKFRYKNGTDDLPGEAMVSDRYSWSMSNESFVIDGTDLDFYVNRIAEKSYCILSFYIDGEYKLGQALVESLSISSGVDDIASMSLSFKGVGPIYDVNRDNFEIETSLVETNLSYVVPQSIPAKIKVGSNSGFNWSNPQLFTQNGAYFNQSTLYSPLHSIAINHTDGKQFMFHFKDDFDLLNYGHDVLPTGFASTTLTASDYGDDLLSLSGTSMISSIIDDTTTNFASGMTSEDVNLLRSNQVITGTINGFNTSLSAITRYYKIQYDVLNPEVGFEGYRAIQPWETTSYSVDNYGNFQELLSDNHKIGWIVGPYSIETLAGDFEVSERDTIDNYKIHRCYRNATNGEIIFPTSYTNDPLNLDVDLLASDPFQVITSLVGGPTYGLEYDFMTIKFISYTCTPVVLDQNNQVVESINISDKEVTIKYYGVGNVNDQVIQAIDNPYSNLFYSEMMHFAGRFGDESFQLSSSSDGSIPITRAGTSDIFEVHLVKAVNEDPSSATNLNRSGVDAFDPNFDWHVDPAVPSIQICRGSYIACYRVDVLIKDEYFGSISSSGGQKYRIISAYGVDYLPAVFTLGNKYKANLHGSFGDADVQYIFDFSNLVDNANDPIDPSYIEGVKFRVKAYGAYKVCPSESSFDDYKILGFYTQTQEVDIVVPISIT